MRNQQENQVEADQQILREISENTEGSLHGIFVAETASTNDKLKELAKIGELRQPTVLITNSQTKGRGTRDRSWFQAAGKDIAFSIALPFEGDDLHDPRFTLAVGAMLASELEAILLPHCPGLAIAHKWPNDILLGQPPRKCGGILVETTSGWMVIGMGLNLNSRIGDFPDCLSNNLTTIREQLGKELDSSELVCQLVVGVTRSLGVSSCGSRASIDIAGWVKKWRSRDATGGKRYMLQRGDICIPVVATGVDSLSGALMCKGADGAAYTVTSYTELEEIT